MSEPVITPTTGLKLPLKQKAAASVRWGFVAAWSIATFASLLALFAWLPWLYPQAALMTPYGQINGGRMNGRMQQPAVTAEPLVDGDRVTALEDKLAALTGRLDTAEPQAAVDAATQRQVLETAAAAIRTDSIQAATQAATQTAAQVAGTAATSAAHTAAIEAVAPLLAAARLEDRLARGASYQGELASLLPVLSESEKADLAPLAGGGPDNAALAGQLDTKQRSLLAAYRESMAVGWLEKIRARLSAIIAITAPDSVPDGANATYAQLHAQVVQDDAAGALASLQMLPPVMQEQLQPVATALEVRAKAKAALAAAIARLTDRAAADKTDGKAD